MEKSWENFWTTGKVEDYLSYRDSVGEKEDKDGTVGNRDWNGAFDHADIGIRQKNSTPY